MSPEKQRVAIATARWWKDCDINWLRKPALLLGSRPTFHNGKIISYLVDQTIPDYLNDLNAIAEARKILTPDQQLQFSIYVGKSVTRMLRVNQAAWMDFCLIDATAKCQSEAFLKALGLWEEEQ